ncbi:MAG TPA: DUF2127 domain-containing protein [Candidatus Binatia bacterium]
MSWRREKPARAGISPRIHRLFTAGVFIKGVDGVLETAGGILFMFVDPAALNRLVVAFTAHELSEDPDDWLARTLRLAAHQVTADSRLFASLYLLAHGIVKIFLTAGLLGGKLWAYPAALWFLGIFILYQLYRFSHTYSAALLALSIFDIFIAGLVWLEYRGRKRQAYDAG